VNSPNDFRVPACLQLCTLCIISNLYLIRFPSPIGLILISSQLKSKALIGPSQSFAIMPQIALTPGLGDVIFPAVRIASLGGSDAFEYNRSDKTSN